MHRKISLRSALLIIATAAVAAAMVAGCDSSQLRQGSSALTIADFFDANPADAKKACDGYFAVINGGFSDHDIYEVLSDSGSFDNFPMDHHTAFKQIVRYCWAHYNAG